MVRRKRSFCFFIIPTFVNFHKWFLKQAQRKSNHVQIIIKLYFLFRLVARLGEYDLSSPEDCVAGVCGDSVVRINVDDIVVHPDYDGKDHDIAVLRLAEDAPYTGKGSFISTAILS